jgi:hypothetical protein
MCAKPANGDPKRFHMINPNIDWTQSNIVALRTFASQHELMNFLSHKKPKITLESLEKSSLSGAFVAGYESCMDNLLAMMVDKPKSDDYATVDTETD